jgi:hypothetical protein
MDGRYLDGRLEGWKDGGKPSNLPSFHSPLIKGARGLFPIHQNVNYFLKHARFSPLVWAVYEVNC